MSVLRANRRLIASVARSRALSSALPEKNEATYTAVPEYPEILDLSFDAKLERKKEARYAEIRAVKTVEEKQIKLNMPRYYGFKCYLMKEEQIPYNSLPLTQHVTRTHLVRTEKLPEYYNGINVDEAVPSVKEAVEEAVCYEVDGYRRLHDIRKDKLTEIEEKKLISSSVTRAINQTILNSLSTRYPHLFDAKVDFDSRIESVWYAGGMMPPKIVKGYRKGTPWQEHRIDEPTNRAMYYLGSACVALRSKEPLLPVVSAKEAENPDLTVPQFKYDPRTVGIATEHRHLANIPGFWPGDPHKFGLLSYHNRDHLVHREHYRDPEENKDALHRQGLLASFAWLNAQANHLGFTTFNDLTYPLVAQTVITDGRLWSFYVYQLNTLLNHSKHASDNPKRNICWATPELELYKGVQNGKLVGFNEDVVGILTKLYSNAPEARLGVNITPYLSKEEKVSADYGDDEKRAWLEREYKFLMANRPRYKLPYEIYAWEKIYKIDNEMRFMDKRLRPFERKVNPYDRPLDSRKPEYIPRALRPDLPRHKGRDAKEYFP